MHTGEGRFNALLDGNDALHTVPFFINFIFKGMDGIVFAVFQLIPKLGGALLLQCLVEGVPEFYGTGGGRRFGGGEVP